MSIVLKCPRCGKRYDLEGSLAGKKVRCTGCDQVFRVQVGSSEPRSAPGPAAQGPTGAKIASPPPGAGRARPHAVKNEDPGEYGDRSWLEEGALASESMPPPIRRTRTTAAGGGTPLGLLLGLGAGGLVILGVVVGLLVMNSGPGPRPKPDQVQARASDAPAPSLTERFLSAVTGSESPFTDVASYPQIGPLLPPERGQHNRCEIRGF